MHTFSLSFFLNRRIYVCAGIIHECDRARMIYGLYCLHTGFVGLCVRVYLYSEVVLLFCGDV